MIPICKEQGCRVHRKPGPEQQACVLACVLGYDDDRPKKKAPVVEAPVVEAPVVEAPVVEAPVVEPLRKRKGPPRFRNKDVVHLGLGSFQRTLPPWRSRPAVDPPWELAPCGNLGHGMTHDPKEVTCKACHRSLVYKKRATEKK